MLFIFSSYAYADESDAIKQGLLSNMSSGIASSIASVIVGQGTGVATCAMTPYYVKSKFTITD